MAHETRDRLREQIAHLAARLMAEDGIEDYAQAKRKAARQAGVSDAHDLPGNDEIEAALRAYRELYHGEHAEELRALRELALELMDELEEFEPWLTGAVLSGTAGPQAPIDIQLYTDSSKDVEINLLNRDIPFNSGTRHYYAGREAREAPWVSFDRDGVEVRLIILEPRDLRTTLKTSPEGKPLERARRAAVAALLDKPAA